MITYDNKLEAEDYNRLRETAGWSIIEKGQAETGLRNSVFRIRAIDEGKTVGMARLISDGGYVAFIADVVVHPDYQKMGIGKHMITSIMSHITDNMKEGQMVAVQLMAAENKEAFYEQFGFVRRPCQDGGSGMVLRIFS